MRNKNNWSRRWYNGLSDAEHDTNDEWFVAQLDMLKDNGFLHVPSIGKSFNKQGVEVTSLPSPKKQEGYSIRLDLSSEEDYNYLICAIEDWKPTGIVNMTNWRPDGSDNN